MSNVLLEVRHLKKSYSSEGVQTQTDVLKGISFQIEKGEFVSVMGPSGSGKSTLLYLIGALDRPNDGEVLFEGKGIRALPDSQLSSFRRRHLGFVFQQFNLVPTLTVVENVLLPILLDGKRLDEFQNAARKLLEKVGLKNRIDHYPNQLSGGEMQRVAIARALIIDPILILADEPTGNLDSQTGKAVLELFSTLVREQKKTVLMVTHDSNAAAYGSRLIQMKDGQVIDDSPVPSNQSS